MKLRFYLFGSVKFNLKFVSIAYNSVALHLRFLLRI